MKQNLNIRIHSHPTHTPFHFPTEEERLLKQRQEEFVSETNRFLEAQFPILFTTPIQCQDMKKDWCLETWNCSWCQWPHEQCVTTEVAYLLPTQERCVDGGIPYGPEEVPDVLCGSGWFDICYE